MNVILVNKYFFIKGGAEKSFFYTANLLKKHGNKISYFSMSHPMNFPSDFAKYFVSNIDFERHTIKNILKSSGRVLYSFEAKSKIEGLLEKEKPEIAHLNNIYHQISPSIIHSLKKRNIPIVMSLRDYKIVCASYSMIKSGKICEACRGGKYYFCFIKGCVKDSRAKSLLNTIEMYLHHSIMHIYNLVDVFISPSMFLKKKVEEMGFKGRIEYLPNFVEVDDYKPSYESSENSICYVGRLSKEKGIKTLMDAVRGVDVELKIIGGGPLKLELELKKENDKADNIQFMGYMSGEKLKDEVRKSIAVVVPSECYENNPRSIIEAFSLGKVCIGARIGGIPELIKDKKTGITFETGNVLELRKAIQGLITDSAKIVNMGKNARKFVESELNADMHYEKLINIYKSVM